MTTMTTIKGRLLATAAIGALSVGSAGAADMRAPVKAPLLPPPPCAQFGGFYVGGQVGGTLYDHRWQDMNGFIKTQLNPDIPDTSDTSKGGWNAGVTAGYNWQTTRCTVFGFEADWNWTNANATKYLTSDSGSEDVYVSSKMKSFGTLRTRAGVVVDNLFLYATGGLAWARFDRSFTIRESANVDIFSSNDTRWGWTLGMGTEWAINSNWSVKSDVLYLGFTSKETSFTSSDVGPGGIFRVDNKDSAWVTRVGLNYRWGVGKAPVVARY
jgi:outer membrane immunogenic protein